MKNFPIAAALFVCILSFLDPTAALAQQKVSKLVSVRQNGVVRVCQNPAYYAISFRNPKSGELEGIDVDLSKEFAKELNVKLQIVETNFGTFIADLQADKCDIGMFAVAATYLFHRLDERFDGRPTLLILDEAWVYLDNPIFAARIREWLKVLRKKNVSVVFATQSLADIALSIIAPAIIESCPQRILLPNDRAIEPQSRAAYERFGLNDRQIELVARATPKRHYYLQSRRGNRLFELGLGPIALALCGASSPADQQRIDRVLAEQGADGFAAAFLADVGLDWAADLLRGFPSEPGVLS